VDENKMLGWSLGGGKRVQEAAALRCECGYAILCEVRREGERVGFLAFYDGEPTSETYTKQVESCPYCGKQLGVFMLSLKTKLAWES
jgi:DNA-directed RNA polymerase subunit RPC12/RpoP